MSADAFLDETDATKPLSRRARKALAVRRALFDAGLAAFERQPIGLVSILDITEAADVAKGVFYLHFRSKDEYLLALWEEVRRRFLEGVGAVTAGCRSGAARIEAAARELASLAKASPASARFWIRMAGYFPDEVGEPGHLARIKREYVEHLAGLLAGRPADELTRNDVRAAQVVDTICWALIGSSLSTDKPPCDDVTIVRIVASAVRTLGRRVE